MPRERADKTTPSTLASTRVLKFLTDTTVPAGIGISSGHYSEVDGYRHLNIFVRFSQQQPDETSVDLGVMFAFDGSGEMATRRYVNLEENLPNPQSTNFVFVSGADSWHGSPHDVSTYLARFPVMGPFVQVFVYNLAPIERTVSVWGYLVS
jgi:hypothetical protein